ncbi:MAG: hypothetical protein OJF48_001877 [Afipia sp.]|jgi:hypothetical protein|nr:MAG: hypothetical protein OJF48_001877 [Afipia sp.]
MLFAIAGAWLALAGAAPTNDIVKVQETLGGKVQPFHRDQLRLAADECRSRMAKENPTVKLTSNFMLGTRTRNETVVKFFNVPPDDMVALVATALFTNAIGGPRKGIMTCKFDIKDKRLVYNRMDRVGMLSSVVTSGKK